MYTRRVISDLTGVFSSIWYLATFPSTILFYFIARVVRSTRVFVLSLPLSQWLLSPRYGTNLVSRVGRILFTSRNVHSLLGGGLAGLAFLVIYFDLSVHRFDGTYYVEFGDRPQAYAQEAQALTTIEMEDLSSPDVDKGLMVEQQQSSGSSGTSTAVHGEIRAGYVAPTVSFATPAQFSGSFVMPLRNPPRLLITTFFRAGHPGLDLSTEMGTPLYAAGDGVVTSTGSGIWAYGKVVTVDHGDGWQTMYAHMSRVDVKVGDYVSQASVIGAVGSTGNSTGPHVHFELHRNGLPVNPKGLVAGL